MAQYQRRSWGCRYAADLSATDCRRTDTPPLLFVQRYPPLSSYLDADTAPATALLRLALAPRRRNIEYDNDDDNDMDRLALLLQAEATIGGDDGSQQQQQHASPYRRIQPPGEEAGRRRRVEDEEHKHVAETQRIRNEMRAIQSRLHEEHQQAAAALRQLLQRGDAAAATILAAEEKKRRDDDQAAQQQRREAEAEERRHTQRVAREEEAARESKARAASVQAADAAAAVAIEHERTKAAKKAAAAATEHVAKADKLRGQLVELQRSVAVFDTVPTVAKRRLSMKKTVNGRVNTLAENVAKIRLVAAEVLQAVAVARQDDAHAKETPAATPEMALGKRYLLNLLAAKVIVRVQAEGFNGYVANCFFRLLANCVAEVFRLRVALVLFLMLDVSFLSPLFCRQRGDGFPLASMVALVSVDAKDFVPVMTAHIFTVCPTAVPTLPLPSDDASEDELMESLGMLRGKGGEFESFERFLSRIEVKRVLYAAALSV